MWLSRGAVFLGAGNGLLLDSSDGYLGVPFFMLYFFFSLIFSVTVSHSFNKRVSYRKAKLEKCKTSYRNWSFKKKKRNSAQLLRCLIKLQI